MVEVTNSDVMRNVLETLINISGRKTSRGHAINTVDIVMKNLKTKYNFLKNIKIKDDRFIEDQETVSVMSDIDKIDSTNMGQALNDIIKTTYSSLGNSAGHFFIKELQRNTGFDHNSVMKDMGVDLGIMQLEKEINDLSKTITHKK